MSIVNGVIVGAVSATDLAQMTGVTREATTRKPTRQSRTTASP